MKFNDLQTVTDKNKGYITGQFEGVFHKAPFEVAVKKYKKGEYNPCHCHSYTNEINVILQGKAMMQCDNDKSSVILLPGDILKVEKNEWFDFMALEDTTMLVIKDTAIGEKYTKDSKYSEETVKYLKHLGIDVDKIV